MRSQYKKLCYIMGNSKKKPYITSFRNGDSIINQQNIQAPELPKQRQKKKQTYQITSLIEVNRTDENKWPKKSVMNSTWNIKKNGHLTNMDITNGRYKSGQLTTEDHQDRKKWQLAAGESRCCNKLSI